MLIEAPSTGRLNRLARRDGVGYRDDWFSRWNEAEDHYFGRIVPPSSFDLVLQSRSRAGR